MKYSRYIPIVCIMIFFLCNLSVEGFAIPMQPPPYPPNPILEWSHAYGGLSFDEGRAVIQTSDGGYVIAGTTNSLSNDNSSRALLLKTDANGTVQWIKTYGDGGNNTRAYSMISTSDGGYAIAGKSCLKSNNSTSSDEDVLLIKTDPNGNLLWQKFYGGPRNDSGLCVIQTNDMGYAILGYTESFGNGGKDAYLVKVDVNGNLRWNRTYGGKRDDIGYDIVQNADGGYSVTGRLINDVTVPGQTEFFYLITTDTDGNLFNVVKGNEYASGFSIINASANIPAMNVMSHGYYDVALPYYRDNWTIFKAYDVGDTDNFGYSALMANDDKLIVAGFTTSYGSGNKDVLFFKAFPWGFNSYRNGIQWIYTYGGKDDDLCYSVYPTQDGGNILVGSTSSFGNGNADIYLLKIGYNNTSHGYPGTVVSIGDNPGSTNITQFLEIQGCPTPTASPLPSPDVAYLAIPAIFVALAFWLRKIK